MESLFEYWLLPPGQEKRVEIPPRAVLFSALGVGGTPILCARRDDLIVGYGAEGEVRLRIVGDRLLNVGEVGITALYRLTAK